MISKYEKIKDAKQKATEWLKDRYGVEFDSRSLPLGKKLDGSIGYHKFDLVSPDNQIVVEVKTHKITASGNISSVKIMDVYIHCQMLARVAAKKKILIITDKSFYNSLLRNSDGRIPTQIEIVCISDEQQPVLVCS